MLFDHFPVLHTPRLTLRELRSTDNRALLEVFSDAELVRYYDSDTLTELQQAQELISFLQERFHKGTGIRWAITLREKDRLIGTCGFNSWSQHNQVGVIGYELGRPYWNQGLVTEALAAMLTFGFKTGKLNRVEAMVMLGNVASERVLQKLGFRLEGVLREKGHWKGAFHDLEMFALLRRDFNR